MVLGKLLTYYVGRPVSGLFRCQSARRELIETHPKGKKGGGEGMDIKKLEVTYLGVTRGTCRGSCHTWRVRVFHPESGLGTDCSCLQRPRSRCRFHFAAAFYD
jgi:hypothetical protein